MSPEAQRIAIAEACGLKPVQSDDRFWDFESKKVGAISREALMALVPDYLNDLNAMHEAEKVLTSPQRDEYRDFIAEHYRQAVGYTWDDGSAAAIHAPAAQRAEAFLRTLGLWQP